MDICLCIWFQFLTILIVNALMRDNIYFSSQYYTHILYVYGHLIIFCRCLILFCKWYPKGIKEWVEVLIISQPYHNIIEKSTMNVQPYNGLEDIAILIRRFIAYVYVTYIHIFNSTFYKYFINNLRKWLQIAYYYYDVYMRVIS